MLQRNFLSVMFHARCQLSIRPHFYFYFLDDVTFSILNLLQQENTDKLQDAETVYLHTRFRSVNIEFLPLILEGRLSLFAVGVELTPECCATG